MPAEGRSPAAATLPADQRHLVRGLGLLDATAVVAGSMIGSGIFIVSADIARQVEAPAWLLLVWVISGVMTVVSGLCYGELAAMMPHAGGQYVYLREAYGPLVGFLYGWTLLLVIQSGTIAAVAVGFGKYAAVLAPQLLDVRTAVGPLTISVQQLIAIGVIVVLTLVNCRGLQAGRMVQNVFTITKIGALLGLIGIIFALGRDHTVITHNLEQAWGPPAWSWELLPVIGAAMVGALFSADAWNNVTFTAGEVRDPARIVPLSLALGTGLVITIYVLANVAYLAVLPLHGSPSGATVLARGIQYAASDRVATAAMERIFGAPGALVMAVAILVSTFGCVNGMVLAGARVCFAMARDGLFFRAASALNENNVPAGALILQGIWAAMLTLSGTYSDLLDYVIFAALLFYVLTVGAIFVLRRRQPATLRPHRAIGYPVVPALYIGLATLVMADLLVMKPRYTWPGLLIVLSGIPAYWLWHRKAPGAR